MADQEITLTVMAKFQALLIALLQLKYQGNVQETPFQTHPRTMHAAVIALVMCWLLFGIKLKFPEFYLRRTFPLGEDFFGSLSMASTASLLLPEGVRPLVYFICLVAPTANILIELEIRLTRRAYGVESSRTCQDISRLTISTIFLALVLAFMQLKYHDHKEKTPFSTHPIIVGVAVISLVICWLLYGIKLKFPRLYQICNVSLIGADLFGSLSLASTISLLLPDFVRPLVYFLLPGRKILYWIFNKLEQHFGEMRFWTTSVEPVLRYLRNRVFHRVEQINIFPL